jgi:hypothetical protein
MKIRMIGYCYRTYTENAPISAWFDVIQDQVDLFVESMMQFELSHDLEHYVDLANKKIDRANSDREKRAKLKAELEG